MKNRTSRRTRAPCEPTRYDSVTVRLRGSSARATPATTDVWSVRPPPSRTRASRRTLNYVQNTSRYHATIIHTAGRHSGISPLTYTCTLTLTLKADAQGQDSTASDWPYPSRTKTVTIV